jgi:hypothetical protein
MHGTEQLQHHQDGLLELFKHLLLHQVKLLKDRKQRWFLPAPFALGNPRSLGQPLAWQDWLGGRSAWKGGW